MYMSNNAKFLLNDYVYSWDHFVQLQMHSFRLD